MTGANRSVSASNSDGGVGPQQATIRTASPEDLTTLDMFIRALAREEGLPEPTATLHDLESALFESRAVAAALMVQVGEQPGGFALYYHKYGTVTGRRGIHLEDLYIVPELRGQRLGQQVLAHLANLAGPNAVLEWWVLHSNDAALRFYRRLGAASLDDIAVYRLEGEALAALAVTREEASTPGWQIS
jgi:ribosomal protein S18 acetylase RimI-like enzyme